MFTRQKNLGAVAVSGKVESGIVSTGDKLLLMPLNEVCTVKALQIHGEQKKYVFSGESADIGLTDIEYSHVNIGAVLCDPEFPVSIVKTFTAHIVTFSLSKPITNGYTCEFYHQSFCEPVEIKKLISILDKLTAEVKSKNPRFLNDQQAALVKIQSIRPLCIEKFSDFKQLGRFTLREGGRTIAAGIVTEIQ